MEASFRSSIFYSEEKIKELTSIMRFFPRLIDVAAHFDCNPLSVEQFIKDRFGMTFLEFRERNFSKTRLGIKQKAFTMALEGNVRMLEKCLEKYDGWGNNFYNEDAEDDSNSFNLKYDESKL